jgi:hypothetical protein
MKVAVVEVQAGARLWRRPDEERGRRQPDDGGCTSDPNERALDGCGSSHQAS